MNEKIKELAEQAGFELNPAHFNHEKFAELIVKECADQCTHDGPFTAEVVWGKQFREKILKHFGVE